PGNVAERRVVGGHHEAHAAVVRLQPTLGGLHARTPELRQQGVGQGHPAGRVRRRQRGLGVRVGGHAQALEIAEVGRTGRPAQRGGQQAQAERAQPHAARSRTALTIFSAPSERSLAAITSRPLSLMIFLPSSAFVPSSRTTSGTFRPTCLTAATTPWARMSQRAMPPKMLTNMPFTLGSAMMILKAAVTLASSAPPPTSRKLAGSAP